MTRLAFIDPQSYHNLAKYDARYLHGLRDAGFDGEIRFYCSTLMDRSVPPDVAVRRVFHYNRKRSPVTKLLSYAATMTRLLAGALREPADIYHFQWLKFPPLDLPIVLLLRRLTGARVVYTAHNVVPHGEEQRRHRALGAIYRAVDCIVVHNAGTGEEVRRRFAADASRIRVLRHGPTDLEPRGEPRHRQAVDRFRAERAVCFAFLGRGRRYKGLDVLLEAWRAVAANEGWRAGLIVMGSVDPDLEELAASVARESSGSMLLVNEHVPEADLHHAAMSSDVVVLPHRHVSHSGVLASVLGLRVPVLVSTVPGLLEALEVADVGWTFDGSERDLAARLTFLAAHREVVAATRANDRAWEAIGQAYGWTKTARDAASLYRELT